MKKSFMGVIVMMLLASCRESDAQVVINVIYQNQFCSSQSQLIEQLSDQRSLQAAIGSPRMLGKTTELPAVDFSQSYLLLIAMGSRPSAGYHLTLSEPQSAVYNDKLLLPVVFNQPEPGMMQAAVMTSPCMIVSLAKGRYRQVAIQTENELLSVELRPIGGE